MGLFVRDDDYDESMRMSGFNRYKQLLSFHGTHWVKLNIITCIAALPMGCGILYSLATGSIPFLLLSGFFGGFILGPFLAALTDHILRGMRDDPGNRWMNYRKGLRQNWKESLIPGALFGLLLSVYIHIIYMDWVARILSISTATKALLLVGAILFAMMNNLFWPQLVLFRQPLLQTIRNMVLFTAKYLWKMIFTAILQLAFVGIHILFAPYTMLLLPFLTFWYVDFLGQFLLYDALNQEFRIEEKLANQRV